MSNQVAIRDENSFDVMLKDVESMQKMCDALMKTKHYQTMGQDGIFAIVQKAKSLNINPLDALNGGLYFVQGKVGMSSEMMASLIRQKGHSIIKDSKSDNSICILHGKRADNGDTWTIHFSMDDAKRAGIAKHMYEKYPAIMLYNRAMSMLARQLFPDVIKGAGYTQDELKEIAVSRKSEEKVVSFDHCSTQEIEVSSIVEEENLISSEQADELNILLEHCDEKYKKRFNEWILGKGISAIQKLPTNLYTTVKDTLLKKSTEYQNSLKGDQNGTENV